MVLILVLVGCSGAGGSSLPDALEPGVDPGTEGPDADAGHDADLDRDGDSTGDADPEPDTNAGVDGDADSDIDTGFDGDAGLDLDSGQDADSLPDVAVRTGPIRAMSFNLRTGFGDLDENSWENRQALVADVVRTREPDLIGVQEAWMFQVDFLHQEVPGYDWAGISRSAVDPDFDEFSAVFWRADRFDAESSGTFWLGEDPDLPGSTFGPAQLYPRIVTWVRLLPRDGSGAFLFMNTHFDYKTEDFIQEKSAALLVAKAAEIGPGLPMIATGDFNAAPASPAWNIMTGAASWEGVQGDFVDSWLELGLPETGTFHGFSGVSNGARIDWVMHANGWKALAAEVVRDPGPENRYPSDHFPVWADLERVDDAAAFLP
jgi:endonuclease/exonuclease/phosphatase family metal-dependent hydrolase